MSTGQTVLVAVALSLAMLVGAKALLNAAEAAGVSSDMIGAVLS